MDKNDVGEQIYVKQIFSCVLEEIAFKTIFWAQMMMIFL